MKRAIQILVWLLAGCSGISAGEAALKLDLRHKGVRISPLLYGIFNEEYNHACDGGLYGELVRNRSFLEGTTPVS